MSTTNSAGGRLFLGYRWIVSLILAAGICGGSRANGESEPPPSFTHVFTVQGGVAAFSSANSQLHFFKVDGTDLKETSRFPLKGQIAALAETPQGLVVATGMGRGDLAAPIRLTLYSGSGVEKTTIFETSSERPQVTFLRWDKDRLWMTYFESKFYTKTGYLVRNVDGSWRFNELATTRLGDVTGVYGGGVLLGRPYGEKQGQDGDLLYIANNRKDVLPTYRGVRALASWHATQGSPVVIGDGWHQNYGQLAQARLSLLTQDSATERFALQIIDIDANQYGFSKLLPFEMESKRYVAALGNKSVAVYGPDPTWEKVMIYSRRQEDQFFDVAVLHKDKGEMQLVILDKGLHVLPFKR